MKRTISMFVVAILVPAALSQLERNVSPVGPLARLAVAWNDPSTGRGVVRLMSTQAPFRFITRPLDSDPNAALHQYGGRLYVVSRSADTIALIDLGRWAIVRTFTLPEGSQPLDIAVVSSQSAYVSRAAAAHLLRLNLTSGGMTEVVDLSVFADEDGVPDMNRLTAQGGRLFVQIRRLNDMGGFTPPACLAVVDLATEELIDADPDRPGVQPIVLVGTPPRFRMQIVWPNRLFVSATGQFWDEGGLEMIDLDALRSLGLVIAEASHPVGADLGAFVLVSPERGYLTFSTDLLLSSHLHGFTVAGVVEPGELHTSLNYFAPALACDPVSRALFVPHVNADGNGVHAFDVETNRRLTDQPVRTSGPPTDLLLLTPTAVPVPDSRTE